MWIYKRGGSTIFIRIIYKADRKKNSADKAIKPADAGFIKRVIYRDKA